jgi:hypothetical protein
MMLETLMTGRTYHSLGIKSSGIFMVTVSPDCSIT